MSVAPRVERTIKRRRTAFRQGRKRTQSHSEKDDYGVHLKAWAASGHRLSRGLPNTDGARSSRNRSNCALTPTPCPDAALSGSTASTANCQVVAV